jgi:iron(III) transport system substrate-binding protein
MFILAFLVSRFAPSRPGPGRLAALVVATVLAAGGCGGSDSDSEASRLDEVVAAVEGLDGKARRDRLRELAAKEGGTLSLYTSLASDDQEEITSAFEDAYDLKVSVYRASDEAVSQRLAEEHDAAFHGADVVETDGTMLTVLKMQSILAPYEPAARAALVSGSSHDGWTADRLNTFVVAWNTDRVAPEERPRTWEELAEPRWRGKLGLESGDFDWYQGLREYWLETGRSEAETDRLFEAIARNAVVVTGHSLQLELLASGELDVVASAFRNQVQAAAKDGGPVAWQPVVEPVFVRAGGIAVVRGTRHPAAALLFSEWLLDDGQEIVTEVGRDPTRRDLTATKGIRQRVIDVVALAEDEQEWADRYSRLLRLGTAHE